MNTQLDNETFSSKDKRFTWQRPFMVAGKNECLVEVECLQCVLVLFKPKKAGGRGAFQSCQYIQQSWLSRAETNMQPKSKCVIIFALKFYKFLPPHYAKHTFRDAIKMRLIPNLHDVLRICYMHSKTFYHVLLFINVLKTVL